MKMKCNWDFGSVDSMINNDIKNGYPGCVLCVAKDNLNVIHKFIEL